jgi:hypothetical protein
MKSSLSWPSQLWAQDNDWRQAMASSAFAPRTVTAAIGITGQVQPSPLLGPAACDVPMPTIFQRPKKPWATLILHFDSNTLRTTVVFLRFFCFLIRT